MEHLHDRVEVDLRRSGSRVLPLTVALLLLVPCTIFSQGNAWLTAIPVALGLLFLITILVAPPRGQRLVVTDRYVAIDDEEILLSELDRHSVSGPDHDPYLLITGRYDQQRLVVSRRPREELEYLEEVVDHALQAYLRRERAEGREYGIDRVVPEALRGLKER